MRAAEELRYLILAAQREGNRLLAQGLRPLGLTPSQAEVIRILSERDHLTLTGLGELLVCDSGTNPSRLVDRLVTAGLVGRGPSATDRRAVVLSLTSSGAALAEDIGEVEAKLYAFIDASLDARQQEQVATALRALVHGTLTGEALARRSGTPRRP